MVIRLRSGCSTHILATSVTAALTVLSCGASAVSAARTRSSTSSKEGRAAKIPTAETSNIAPAAVAPLKRSRCPRSENCHAAPPATALKTSSKTASAMWFSRADITACSASLRTLPSRLRCNSAATRASFSTLARAVASSSASARVNSATERQSPRTVRNATP